VLSTLYDINKDLKKTENDVATVGAQLQKARTTVMRLVRIADGTEKTLKRQRRFLAARLRALYKLGYQGYAKVLLSSQSGDEFSRNLKFLKIISQKDAELIDGFRRNLDHFNEEQRRLKAEIKTYAVLEKQYEFEKDRFQRQKHLQLTLLRQIDTERETHLAAIQELRDAARGLEQKIAGLGGVSAPLDLTRGTFFEQRGRLKPPTTADLVQRYGIIKNPKFKTEILHKGWFFNTSSGDPVTSLFFGRVAYAGWIDGFGETVIVDHGDHYYSLYAHNSKLMKKLGDEVVAGEIVARSGDSGSLRGPGVYLEIRHFSESLDPSGWLDLAPIKRLSLRDNRP
jgi:septal ring factor EnvC (AmiA/AmiB activator)